MKKIIFLLLVFTLSFSSFSMPKAYNFVNDFSNVVDDNVEKELNDISKNIKEKTGAEISVAVVESLDGKSVEDYANELFRDWAIGDKEKNNGVLLLVSTGDRKIRFEVGYGLEGALNDGKTGAILDEFVVPYLKKDDYSKGVRNGYLAIAQVVAKEYGLENITAPDVPKKKKSTDPGILIFIIVIIIVNILFGRGGRGGRGGGIFFGGGGGFGGGSSGGGGFGGFGGGSSGGGGSSRGF